MGSGIDRTVGCGLVNDSKAIEEDDDEEGEEDDADADLGSPAALFGGRRKAALLRRV
jgi:hypothetical protein